MDLLDQDYPLAFGQARRDLFGKHLLHLVRHARHCEYHRIAYLGCHSRRGARGIVQRLGSSRDHRLRAAGISHVPPAPVEERLDVGHTLWVDDKFGSHGVGQALAGDVVGGGPEPSAEQHYLGGFGAGADCGGYLAAAIAHRPLLTDLYAEAAQLLGQVGAVGVDGPARGQLISYGDNNGLHARESSSMTRPQRLHVAGPAPPAGSAGSRIP